MAGYLETNISTQPLPDISILHSGANETLQDWENELTLLVAFFFPAELVTTVLFL